MLQVGQQRFLDVWDDGCGLHNILKINADSQTLSLMPVDPELLEDLIDNKTVNLQGRTEGGGRWFLTEILLTSSTEDLHKFLAEHAGDKGLFKDAAHFRRK